MRKMVVFILALILISTFLFKVTAKHMEKEIDWISNDFKQNIEIITDPPIPPYGDANPAKGQNVNITIKSKNNQKIELAYITVYAYNWDGTDNPSCSKQHPGNWTFKRISDTEMYIIINNYKYFPPGSTVYWRITAFNYSGNITKLISPWYSYTVGGAWPYHNFDDCVDIIMQPDVINGEPVLAGDPVHIELDSSKCGVKIGYALLHLKIKNETGTYEGAIQFFPKNSYHPKLMYDIPGYPAGWKVEFWIEVWDDPNDDRRKLISEKYSYVVQPGHSWPPDSSFYDNIDIYFNPPLDEVKLGDEVNITIISKNKSIPITYAFIDYEIGIMGTNQSQTGKDAFTKITSTKWYYVIPPLSPGVYIKFKVIAYDAWLNPIISDTYSYQIEAKEFVSGGTLAWFYVAVFDYSIPGYVAGAKVVIENDTWKCVTYTNFAGFCYPNETGSSEVHYLHFGTYKVTVYYNGMVKTVIYNLSMESLEENPTLTIEFNSPNEPVQYARSVPPQYFTLIVSYLVMAVVLVVVVMYDIKRRKKLEKLRKRITV